MRKRVIEALPETANSCSCRIVPCLAAEPAEANDEPCAWVEVTMFPGRSLAKKRALYSALVAGCAEGGIVNRAPAIVVHEPSLDNWGIRGGHPASDFFGPPRQTGEAT